MDENADTFARIEELFAGIEQKLADFDEHWNWLEEQGARMEGGAS